MNPLSNTKITDVNVDCLEKIFSLLGVDDLLNVADANKHLKKAADLVYTVKYGGKGVWIQSFQRLPKTWPTSVNEGYIIIYAAKPGLQILRCFGHLIPKLDIWPLVRTSHGKFDSDINHVMNYSAEYCSTGRLNEIQILSLSSGVSNNVNKSFQTVKKVVIYGDNLSINQLNTYFPKMQNLELLYSTGAIQNGKYVATDFANVEKLFPYLEYMEITSNYSSNSYSLATLEKHTSVIDSVNLRNLKSFGDYKNEHKMAVPLFDHLEQICLTLNFEDDANFYAFFRKYSCILKLKLTSNKLSEENLNLTELAATLPTLKEIDSRCCKFTSHGAIEWIDHFKSLTKFSFYVMQHSEYIDLQRRLGSEWQGTCSCDATKYVCEFIRN